MLIVAGTICTCPPADAVAEIHGFLDEHEYVFAQDDIDLLRRTIATITTLTADLAAANERIEQLQTEVEMLAVFRFYKVCPSCEVMYDGTHVGKFEGCPCCRLTDALAAAKSELEDGDMCAELKQSRHDITIEALREQVKQKGE